LNQDIVASVGCIGLWFVHSQQMSQLLPSLSGHTGKYLQEAEDLRLNPIVGFSTDDFLPPVPPTKMSLDLNLSLNLNLSMSKEAESGRLS
jgi:hypothetical protein